MKKIILWHELELEFKLVLRIGGRQIEKGLNIGHFEAILGGAQLYGRNREAEKNHDNN